MRLPHADRVIIDARKLRDYVLSLEHPVGRFKALFFGRLGFVRESWQELRAELRRIVLNNDAEVAEGTEYGQKYIVRGTIAGPTGRGAEVLTVWIVLHGEAAPRFVTVYPEH